MLAEKRLERFEVARREPLEHVHALPSD